MNKDVKTRGNVTVNNLQVGDEVYEYDMGYEIKTIVSTKPTRDEKGYWTWEGKLPKTGKVVRYGVHEDFPHYAAKLYTYRAYLTSLNKVI